MGSVAFTPPRAITASDVSVPSRRAPSTSHRSAGSDSPADTVFSWDTSAPGSDPGTIRTVTVRSSESHNSDMPQNEAVQSSAARTSSHGLAALAGEGSTQHVADSELLRAFLAGSGMQESPFPNGLTPEVMTLLGQLLRGSHQFGFMAGMRAALEGVLARFDPARLEHRLAGGRTLNSFLPSNRRAKLWELYEQLHRDILKEAEDSFETLFGKEFLRAYEAQVGRLERKEGIGKS